MCGIFGLYREAGVRDGRLRASRAIASLGHRGGDGEGVETDVQFAFGHTRLSLLDLGPGGTQPMWNAERSICLVFAGEIYNHQYLRQKLSLRGTHFRTRSDTEVILLGYEQHGRQFLTELDGMFAIGIYDSRDRSCTVARDRVGVKPVFYRWNGEELAFCIEPGPLNQHPYNGQMAKDGTVSSFLNYRFTLGEQTLWDGIRMLQPGCSLSVRDGKISHERWSSLSITRPASRQKSQSFSNIFSETVKDYASADVPVGLFLSGGLDSSLIAAAMPASMREGMPTFTARINTKGYDESTYARTVARYFALNLEEVEIDPRDHNRELDRLTMRKGFPLALHNEVAVAILARTARQHVKAAMSGEAADELAGGYGRLARIPFEATKAGASPDDHESALALFLRQYGYFPLNLQLPLLRPEHREAARAALKGDESLISTTWHSSSAASPLGALCATMTQLHLPILLHMMDAMTMAENLELRVPFTSRRVVDLLLHLPDDEKLAWRFPGASWLARRSSVEYYSERLDRTKQVFREAFRQKLPREVLSRRKLGFPLPWGNWVHPALDPTLSSLADGADSPLWTIFDRRSTAQWITAAIDSAVPDTVGKQLWMLVGLDRWLRLQQ